MITADQLVLHAVGDYVLQSDWMAINKTKRHLPAFVHALVYSAPFLLLRPSLVAWLTVFGTHGTHFLIDRYGLARYVVWAKNFLGRDNPSWSKCSQTGYPSERPLWLTVWLMIAADNTMHVIINGLSLYYL